MSFQHKYTYKAGDIPKTWVRSARRLMHEKKVTSSLRKKGDHYFLVITAPDDNGLKFAKFIFESAIARAKKMGVSS